MRSERAVYEAVMGWVRHDVGSRKAWLGEMLGAVRMALLPPEYLAKTVGADAVRHSRLEGAARAAAASDGRLRANTPIYVSTEALYALASQQR